MSAEAPKPTGINTPVAPQEPQGCLPRFLRSLIGVQSEPQSTPSSVGFIERLRAEAIATELAEEKRLCKSIAAEHTEAIARQQREAQEREFHKLRRQQAETHLQESGIEPLITELGKIFGYTGNMGTRGWGRLDSGKPQRDWFTAYNKVPSLMTDPDSVAIGYLWDQKKIGSHDADVRERSDHGSREMWDIFEGKYFAVESCPDGNIIFHAKRDITVPEPKWKNRQDILEEVLEQAYNNPRIQKFNGHTTTYFPDGGG